MNEQIKKLLHSIPRYAPHEAGYMEFRESGNWVQFGEVEKLAELLVKDLRDHFAAKAMEAMLHGTTSHEYAYSMADEMRDVAKYAYSMADEMLAVRGK